MAKGAAIMSVSFPPGVAARTALLAFGLVAVAAIVGAGQVSRAGDPTGGLAGRVTLAPRLSTQKLRVRLYLQPGESPVRSRAGSDPYESVVVYVESVPVAAPAPKRGPSRPLEIRQVDERFIPHVLPLVKGSTVEFTNEDPFFHNVFSLSRAATFDLGRYPKGHSESVRFDTPGVVQVFCHIHSDMSAIVLVLENPFFAVPDSAGRYEIDGLPPGEYRVVAWHERARPVAQNVQIGADERARLDFTIPLSEPEP